MMFMVYYWSGQWYPLEQFDTKEEAKEYIELEEERDRYMTRINGIDHTVEYKVEEV